MTIHPEYRDFWAFFLNNNVKQVIVRRPGSIEVSQAEQEGDIGRNNMEFDDTQWCSYGGYSEGGSFADAKSNSCFPSTSLI